MMKIAVDIDGVILDIIVEYCEIYNRRYGTNYKKSDVTKWDFFADWNMDEETGFKIFYEIYEDSQNIPFIGEGAPGIMKKLNERYDLDIVSDSHDIMAGIQYTELILLHHKPYDIKLKQNYDLYVDDNPNLVEPIKMMKNRTLLLFDQPWNQHSVCEDNVYRVYNWNEVDKKIREI